MEQNKGLNMALLAAVFAVSLAVGYFLAQVIVRPDVKAEKEVVSYQYEDQDAESVYETIDSTEYYDSLILALEAEEAAAAQAAVEAAAEEVVEPVKYRLFTKSMMQDFLDQKDWELRPTDSKELFPQWMKIECVGLDYAKDEFAPTTLAAVCNKLMMGDWESVVVSTMTYNSVNQITKVVLRVQYPGGDSYDEEY